MKIVIGELGDYEVNPNVLKVARLLAKRNGWSVEQAARALLFTSVKQALGVPNAVEKMKARLEAEERYCESEGLDHDEFHQATLRDACQKMCKKLRRRMREERGF